MITIDELKKLCEAHTYCMDCPIYKECKESNTAHSMKEFLDNIEEKAGKWINEHSVKDSKDKKEIIEKNEFNDWVQDTYRKFVEDEEATVAYKNDEKIIVLDTETDEISTYNFIESKENYVIDTTTNIAIAYAKLRKIKIPKVEKEPTFKRVREGEKYYTVATDSHKRFSVEKYTERHMDFNESSFKNNNYFHTKERVEEVADKMKFLLKLERLHDTYCPNYKPDWTDGGERKYFIYFFTPQSEYNFEWCVAKQDKLEVYFPTKKIARKVCAELNKELEGEE